MTPTIQAKRQPLASRTGSNIRSANRENVCPPRRHLMNAPDQATDTPDAPEPALDATLAAALRAASGDTGINFSSTPLDIAEHHLGTQTLLRGLAMPEA